MMKLLLQSSERLGRGKEDALQGKKISGAPLIRFESEPVARHPREKEGYESAE